MGHTIRLATPRDIPRLVDLLLMDATERRSVDEILWKLSDNAAVEIEKALTFALTAENQPFRQIWQVSEESGRMTGVVHSMLLPVPPIYAGCHGDPGLILPDSFVAPDAPPSTVRALLEAAETALRVAGARIILSSYVAGDAWRSAMETRAYAPLTLYLSRTQLDGSHRPPNVRGANEGDIDGIVARSAENRRILHSIDPFWEPHPDADTRFAAWMARSLTFKDRDMVVMESSDQLEGYAIAQPASRLHFPPAHDISGTGVIDDYYHIDLADPTTRADGDAGATALLNAAEAAFAKRGVEAAFMVCPAGWSSKIEMLRDAGYKTAMVWYIKR